MKNIRAASVQFHHAANDKAANLEKIRSFVAKAAAHQVELIIFPEMCITGYWHVRKLSKAELLSLAEPVPDGDSTRELLALSAKYQMTIGAGLIELGEDGAISTATSSSCRMGGRCVIASCIRLNTKRFVRETASRCLTCRKAFAQAC